MTTTELSQALQRRQTFLEKAATTFLISDLATAAHLQRARAELGGSTSPNQQQCPACGVVLLLGWSCEQVRQGVRSHDKHRKRRLETIRVSCKLCQEKIILKKSRIESFTVPIRPVARQGTPPMEQTTTPASAPVATSPVTSASTASTSTSRKKSRSKNATLQALLGKQKQAPSQNGFGLGFSDLLKK